jgi:hypothetical protein
MSERRNQWGSLGILVCALLWGLMAAIDEYKHNPAELQEVIIACLFLIAYQLQRLREAK